MSEARNSNCGSALPGAIPAASPQTGRTRKGAPSTTSKPQLPHSSALRKGRWSWPNHCYFVTTNAAEKRPLFATAVAAQAIIDSLVWLQDNRRIRLMGFVVMPDHVHAAFVLGGKPSRPRPEGRSHNTSASAEVVGTPSRVRSGLSVVMNSFKGYTGKKINELLERQGNVWQPAYYDHLVRDERDFRARLDYMHANPTRKGLSQFESDYEFSSANPKHQSLVDWNWLLGVVPVAPGRALPQ